MKNGEIIPLDEQALRVRTYTHGNYYSHYSKLMGKELSNISDRVKYLNDSGTVDYISNKLSEIGALGGKKESEKEKIINEIQNYVKEDANLRWLDIRAVTGVISQLGDFAIESINTPLLNWFAQDAVIKNTWLAGDITILNHDFKGSMTNANDRIYTIYFSELPAGKYEIILSRVLTHNIDFSIFNYSLGGITQLINSTLFTKGVTKSDNPSNIKAYVSVAYRDTDGNIILDKSGNISTPTDQIFSKIVYSGTSAKSATYNLEAEMDWTQRAGYRYKGCLIKYGTYSIYNKPNEMTVTTDSSVSVTSSFSYSGLGISVVFYYEPVDILSVQHKVEGELIDTDKNLGTISIPTETIYDEDDVYYAAKSFTSLNKNFWPGYILTGFTVYKDFVSPSNIIAKQTFDVNTTTKMNSKDDAKRNVTIFTAINSSSDINDAKIVNREKIGYGNDKIIVFDYLYPEVEIKNINYQTGEIIKDLNNNKIEYTIKLIGDNMLIKSLDTTKPRANGYNEINVNLADGGSKNFKYDASNFSLVQAWIYTKDLNKGTKTLQKVIAGCDTFIPSGVASSKIEIANDFASFANLYILNTEELFAVINKVWADVYIEFKYFEGANVVNVSYIDEEGNILMPPEEYKILDKENGKYTATIPVTPINGYKLVKYIFDGEEIREVLDEVKVIDNGTDREIIFVYKKTKKEESDIPPEEYREPFAVIRSNDKNNEEYNVEVAMPTDEDLYANVVTDSYILENVLTIVDKEQKVNVILKKKYYTSSNDNEDMITSDIAVATSTIPLEYYLDYYYMGGANANLYILDTAIIENEAVMDTKHYDKNGKVLIEADYGDNTPNLTYTPGGKLFINNSEECTLVQEGETYYLEVMLDGIDYEKPDMNAITRSFIDDHKEIDQIIRKNATVNGDYLRVSSDGKEIVYLEGNDIYMSAERLASALELAGAGYYYIDSVAPLSNGDVLLNDRNVYTYEKAQNQKYDTTKLTVNYKIHQKVLEFQVEAITSGDEVRVKEYLPSEIYMNDINIYTPIVNYTELIPLTNSGDNDNQLIDETIENVLTLDSVFGVNIPHAGIHKYAVDASGASYDGYGDKAYNYNGSKLYDEIDFAEKGLKAQTFAKEKLIKFSFDVYAIKYSQDGKNILYKKLILANTWFNLGEIDRNTGLNIEKYNFIIPTWVPDKAYGNIQVRIVAGNIPDEYDTKANIEEASYIAKDVSNKTDVYILEEDFEVYIAGVLYDIEIRDSDDPGWMGKLTKALKLINEMQNKNMNLPIGQNNQNQLTGYNYGLKLGYRFYFDLKTKGIASDEIIIKPSIYYVSEEGGEATKNITLFYDTQNKKYVKLDSENDLNILMSMASTHGDINNTGFTFELVRGKIKYPNKNYTVATSIGKIINGINLIPVDSKLPRDNILESANLYGYKGNTTNFITDAKTSEIVEDENTIRNSAGHWYGEFYLPASTKVVLGTNVTSNELIYEAKKAQKSGYIIVTFDTIITKANGEEYLSYSMPEENSRWEKEGTMYEPYEVILPNGNKATISEMLEGTAMAIYEVSLRANDDYETEGTH